MSYKATNIKKVPRAAFVKMVQLCEDFNSSSKKHLILLVIALLDTSFSVK